jgi:hypothetical protein
VGVAAQAVWGRGIEGPGIPFGFRRIRGAHPGGLKLYPRGLSREFCGLMPTHPYELFPASANIEHVLLGPDQDSPRLPCPQLYSILCQEFFALEFRKRFRHTCSELQGGLDLFSRPTTGSASPVTAQNPAARPFSYSWRELELRSSRTRAAKARFPRQAFELLQRFTKSCDGSHILRRRGMINECVRTAISNWGIATGAGKPPGVPARRKGVPKDA